MAQTDSHMLVMEKSLTGRVNHPSVSRWLLYPAWRKIARVISTVEIKEVFLAHPKDFRSHGEGM